jgi:phage FluMu gp28-like protein
LNELADIIDSEPLIAIPKSRRMMVTWLLAAWVTHRARYTPHQAIFWQSENEDKAAAAVSKRCAWIEDHLEHPDQRLPYTSIKTAKGEIGRMTYRSTGSYIWAIPQGGDALRQYTPSVWVCDEVEFQDKATEALVAAMPFAEKGAKLILISSSNGPRGVLAEMCKEVGFVRFKR